MAARKRSVRVAVVVVLLVLFVGGSAGVYGLYRYRKHIRPEKHRLIALEMEAEGDWGMAAKHWRVYLGVHHDDVERLVHYGDILLKQRPLSADAAIQAAAAYRRAARLDPSHRDAHVKLMNLLLAGKSYDDALHVADALWLKDHPDDRDALLVKARALHFLDRTDESLAAYQTLVDQHPDAFDGWRERVQFAREAGKPAEVIQEMLQACVANNPSRIEPLLIRFKDAMRRGDREWATANLVEAEALLAKDPSLDGLEVVLSRVQLQVSEGHLAEAETRLSKIIEEHPSEVRAYMALGRILAMQDRQEEALAAFTKGLPNVENRRELLFLAADVAAALGKNEEAQKYIDALRKAAPRSKWLSYLESRLLLNAGHVSEAAARLERAADSLSDEPVCQFVLGRCYKQLGLETLAWSAFHRAIRLAPAFVAAQKAEARTLLAMGRPGVALKRLRAWIDQNPSDYALLMLAVRSHLARVSKLGGGNVAPEETEAILGLLDQAAALKPDAIEPVEFRAETLRLAGRYEDGIQTLQAALKKQPDSLPLHKALGYYHIRQGDRDAVPKVLAAIVKDCPDTIDARVARATLHAAVDEVDLAKTLLMEGIENRNKKDTAKVYFQLGLILLGARQPREALASFMTATEYAPDSLGIHRAALNLAHMVGTDADLTRLLKAIRGIDGEEGAVWRLEKARYLLAGSADRKPQPEEARKILQEIVESRRRNWPEAIMLLGVCQEMLEDFPGASESYRSAINLDPDNLRNHVMLVDVLNRLGQYDAAEDALAEAANLSTGDDADVLRLRIKQALRQGSETQTMELLERYLTLMPHDMAGHLVFGHMCNQAGQYDQAEKALRAALKLSPNSLLARTQLLKTYILQGHAAKALKEARHYAESEPGAAPHVLLARVYAMLRNRAACEPECAKAVELATPEQKVGLLVSSARLLSALGSERGSEYFEKALEIDPKNRRAVEGLIRTRLNDPNGRGYARALALAKDWAQREPDEPKAALFVILAKKAVSQSAWTGPMIQELSRIIEVYPRAHEARRTFAAAYLATGQIKRAKEQVDYLLGAMPSDRVALELSAEIALNSQNPAHALHQARKLVRLYPFDDAATVTLGRCLRAANKLEDAENVLQRAIQGKLRAAIQTEARLALAMLQLGQDRWPQARSTLEPLLGESLPRYRAAMLVTALARTQAQLDRATTFVAELADQNASDPKLLHVQAMLASKTPGSRSDPAAVDRIRGLFARATAATALAPAVYADWGSYELVLGNLAEAEVAFRKLLALRPENAVALNNLAWLASRSQTRLDEALELIDRAVSLAPWNREAHHTRGQILYAQGKYGDAVLAYRRAIVAGKQDAGLYRDLAKTHLAAGDPYEARRAAETGLERLRDQRANDKQAEALRKELEALSGRT